MSNSDALLAEQAQLHQPDLESRPGAHSSRFAMMLRCSYRCSTIGVANCVPVPVNNMAKKVRCMSLFSEWLRRIIVVAMGAFAVSALRSTFTSFSGSVSNVSYVNVTNRPPSRTWM